MKRSQLDRAVEQLEREKAAIQLAIDKLREQQAVKSTRPRKVKPVAVAERSAS